MLRIEMGAQVIPFLAPIEKSQSNKMDWFCLKKIIHSFIHSVMDETL